MHIVSQIRDGKFSFISIVSPHGSTDKIHVPGEGLYIINGVKISKLKDADLRLMKGEFGSNEDLYWPWDFCKVCPFCDTECTEGVLLTELMYRDMDKKVPRGRSFARISSHGSYHRMILGVSVRFIIISLCYEVSEYVYDRVGILGAFPAEDRHLILSSNKFFQPDHGCFYWPQWPRCFK